MAAKNLAGRSIMLRHTVHLQVLHNTGCNFIHSVKTNLRKCVIREVLCDPYVFVVGKSYQCVDRAVDVVLVQEAIRSKCRTEDSRKCPRP